MPKQINHMGLRQPLRVESGRQRSMRDARKALQTRGLWGHNQQMGNRWPVGCVALEITQRCNLDCDVCYLSSHAETVVDIPVPVLFERIDAIRHHFGDGTNVQVTGGEPTVREPEVLLKVVRRIYDLGMRPTLMTNGILLNRSWLSALVQAGLTDIAFHVDTTQKRSGYETEDALNRVRRRYIDMASDLPIAVYFNTTVWAGNIRQLPGLVRFFVKHAKVVRIASFQLQADTGRGRLERRHPNVTQDTVKHQIEKGAGTSLNFDNLLVGNPKCSRTAICMIANGRVYDALDDPQLVGRIQTDTPRIPWIRARPMQTAVFLLRRMLRQPQLRGAIMRWASTKFAAMKWDLLKSRGHLEVQSYLVHGFMDSDHLDPDRLATCAFKTMTPKGPVSMCLFNAGRDSFFEQLR